MSPGGAGVDFARSFNLDAGTFGNPVRHTGVMETCPPMKLVAFTKQIAAFTKQGPLFVGGIFFALGPFEEGTSVAFPRS